MSLIDLDELQNHCRDKESRFYINEAVNCYKAGAYRMAIVAAWVALVFDYLHKVQLLTMNGHADARQKIADYESARNDPDESQRKKRLMDFENDVLRSAKVDFQFITEMDYQELRRLQNDRNLCAHPTMRSLDEPFVPSAELARYHVRNAVMLFLRYQPTQGRAAEAAIFRNIDAPEFPVDPQLATDFLSSGYLMSHARDGLVKSVVQKLLGALLKHDQESALGRRYLSACEAILRIHTALAESVMGEILPRLSEEADSVNLPRFIKFIRYVPRSWDFMGEAGRTKVSNHIANFDEGNIGVLTDAVYVPQLAGITRERLTVIDRTKFIEFIKTLDNPKNFKDLVVERFKKSLNFDDSRYIGKDALLLVADSLNREEIGIVLKAFIENNQIHDCHFYMPGIMTTFLANTISLSEEVREDWTEVLRKISTRAYSTDYRSLISNLYDRYEELRPAEVVEAEG